MATENKWVSAALTGRVAYIDIPDLSEAAALVLRDPRCMASPMTCPAPTRTLSRDHAVAEQDPRPRGDVRSRIAR